jgi:hypothetical protein
MGKEREKRAALRKLESAPGLTISPDCLDELDRKVVEASQFY